MSNFVKRKIQFVSDRLVEQIIEGRKTASVVNVGEVDISETEYDDPLVVGEYYDVYDSKLTPRCTIRVVAMELCDWNNIPEKLWQGETNDNADEFREDHLDFFVNPGDGFEFVAFYFTLIE